jgi:hypothetical protein
LQGSGHRESSGCVTLVLENKWTHLYTHRRICRYKSGNPSSLCSTSDDRTNPVSSLHYLSPTMHSIVSLAGLTLMALGTYASPVALGGLDKPIDHDLHLAFEAGDLLVPQPDGTGMRASPFRPFVDSVHPADLPFHYSSTSHSRNLRRAPRRQRHRLTCSRDRPCLA